MQLFSSQNATSLTETVKDITRNLFNKNTNHIEQSESNDNMEIEKDTGLNNPPFISYITFNRMGLTIRNLKIYLIPMKILRCILLIATLMTIAGTTSKV